VFSVVLRRFVDQGRTAGSRPWSTNRRRPIGSVSRRASAAAY